MHHVGKSQNGKILIHFLSKFSRATTAGNGHESIASLPVLSSLSTLLSVFLSVGAYRPPSCWSVTQQTPIRVLSTHTHSRIFCVTYIIYVHCICSCIHVSVAGDGCARFLRPHALSPCSSQLVDARRSSDQVVSSLYYFRRIPRRIKITNIIYN